MKVVDRARLGFREGNSDKVYEVDLVEVAPGQYVVNFRYGRRGTALREGTKTPLPLAEAKARVVFGSLVAEKTKGGYRALPAESAADDAHAVAAKGKSQRDEARTARELLAALARGARSAVPLHLVVRKVGELGLSEAEPLLLELLGAGASTPSMKPEILRYFLLAALARCGSSRALPALQAVIADAKAPRHVADMARLAVSMLGGAEARQALRASVQPALVPANPNELERPLRVLEQLLSARPAQAHAAVLALYLSAPAASDASASDADRAARKLVLSVARVAGLRGQELGLLRTLHAASEIRRDGELFALLARRFEAEQHGSRPDTSSYFRRRAARTLRRLGSARSPDYVKMASELLLLYREGDADPVLSSAWGTWDTFARYHALSTVIYGNSPRYERGRSDSVTWRCKAGYQPGQPAPLSREEAYPWLWDEAPEALWRLGTSAAANVVIQFATRALRDQREFLAKISDEALASALSSAQPSMQGLAFEVARQRTPNRVLARGALAANIPAADAWVVAWIAQDPSMLARHPELLALLITAKGEQARAALPGLTQGLVLEANRERELASHTIAILMQLSEEPAADERARCATAFLLAHASSALSDVSRSVMHDLLAHPLGSVAELGAELVLRRSRRAELEAGALDALLGSPHSQVRALGARIVAETPLAILKDEPELLVHLVLSPNAELREATRGVLAELARHFPEVASLVASRLIDALLSAQPAGAPAHAVSVLRRELHGVLPKRDAASVLSLVGALSPHAREAGGLLVAQLDPDEVELEIVVRLASHEILLVRQGAWALARAARARFRVAPVALARLCDARWEDSREFAFGFVRTFAAEDLVPDVAIAICDSVQPLVQRFGEALLLEHFREEHGARYLLRLSEHPSSNIQLLVSGLLERFARGNLPLLKQLVPCLTTILSQVNRGGVAKQRVLQFLRTEAVASEEAAALLAPLLDRQSLTRAVSQRAPLIATLVDLHERYPEVPVPIVSATVPVRARGSRGV